MTSRYPILSGSGPERDRNGGSMCRSGTVFHDGSVGNTCGSSRHADQGDGTLPERLREAISSRLVMRAAWRSSFFSPSWRRSSTTCCSSWVLRRRRSSMSSGPPSPDSRQACSPRASESRSRSWVFYRMSRLIRSCAPARSAMREARLTAGPVVGEAGGSAALAMTRACRSGCR
jgi:hypothetical protein